MVQINRIALQLPMTMYAIKFRSVDPEGDLFEKLTIYKLKLLLNKTILLLVNKYFEKYI